MIAIIDVGNTRTKLRINSEIYFFINNKINEDLIEEITLKYNIDKLYYSSVNNSALYRLKKIINLINYNNKATNIELIDTSKLLQDQTIIDFSFTDGMGNDRKFGLIAAQNIVISPLITIDCGTAITLNVLSFNNRALGGAIFPGLYTSALALKHFTSQLPLIEAVLTEENIINNTEGAINFGIKSTILGGIEYAITQIKLDILKEQDIPLIFTGGYGKYLMEILNKKEIFKNAIFIENLVLDGILLLINKNNK